MRGSGHPLLVLLLAPLLLLLFVAQSFVAVWNEPALTVGDPMAVGAWVAQHCPAPAILVMGAAQYDGVPSAAFERRLAGALSLAEAGCAPQVVVSGGRQERDRLSEGEAGVEWLRGRGTDAVLVAETRATSTVENLRFSAELARVSRWIVVTDDLHAPRTRFAAERLGLEAVVVGVRTERGRWRYAWREVLGMLAYRLGALR